MTPGPALEYQIKFTSAARGSASPGCRSPCKSQSTCRECLYIQRHAVQAGTRSSFSCCRVLSQGAPQKDAETEDVCAVSHAAHAQQQLRRRIVEGPCMVSAQSCSPGTKRDMCCMERTSMRCVWGLPGVCTCCAVPGPGLCGRHHRRQADVRHLRRAIRRQQDVAGFEVPADMGRVLWSSGEVCGMPACMAATMEVW